MEFLKFLAQNKDVVLEKWFNVVVESYPPDTVRFLKKQKDPFANPVGRSVQKGLDDILEAFVKGKDRQAFADCLDPIIRIRALQNFTPSQALSFIFSLKTIIRDLVTDAQAPMDPASLRDLLAFESKIDQLGLIAFEVYMERREKLYEIKATEMRNRTFRAFKRAGLIDEIADKAPDLEEKKP